jgi:thiamine-monophosphate kinase
MSGAWRSPVPVPSDTRVAAAGEHRVIDLVRSMVPPPPAWVTVGLGDDAAVLEPKRNHLEVLTTDALVEHVHFERAFADPRSLGFKALATSLSDLAAMGAEPRAALLSLGLPDDFPWNELEQFLLGFLEAAGQYHVALVGGNVSRSPALLFVNVTLTGSVKRRKALTRGGARPGDELYLTGDLGRATAGLRWLTSRPARADTSGEGTSVAVREALQRFRRPEPRVRLGVLVGRTRAASACIDLSDGFADACHQLAAASGVGLVVDAASVPIHAAIRELFPTVVEDSDFAGDALRAALAGGEDYELLFTVPRRSVRRFAEAGRRARLPVTRVGVVTALRDLVLRTPAGDRPLGAGFDHFHEA